MAGFFGGALLAARLAPLLLEQGKRSPYAPMIALIGAAVGGAGMAIILERVGIKLRKALPLPFMGMFDRLLGGILGLVVGGSCRVAWRCGVSSAARPRLG